LAPVWASKSAQKSRKGARQVILRLGDGEVFTGERHQSHVAPVTPVVGDVVDDHEPGEMGARTPREWARGAADARRSDGAG
jgi:hypothetical protein